MATVNNVINKILGIGQGEQATQAAFTADASKADDVNFKKRQETIPMVAYNETFVASPTLSNGQPNSIHTA